DPFRIDEQVVPALAQELLARDAVQRLHAIAHPELVDAAIRREAVLEDVARRHRRDASIAELGHAQLLFRLLARADLAAHADHAERRAARVRLDDLAALEQPLPATLTVPDSILGLIELFRPDEVGAEPGRDGRPVIGMHIFIPAGGVVVAFAGV